MKNSAIFNEEDEFINLKIKYLIKKINNHNIMTYYKLKKKNVPAFKYTFMWYIRGY